jgi:hypothetical protein
MIMLMKRCTSAMGDSWAPSDYFWSGTAITSELGPLSATILLGRPSLSYRVVAGTLVVGAKRVEWAVSLWGLEP